MATTADQRLLELLEKWLNSLELHLKYASLDDEGYWRVQSWPPHQRPNLWIIDLARQKTIALRDQVKARVEAGDAKFSESLELMIFLANLVGSQHIERFIPLAQSESGLSAPPPLDSAPALGDQSPTAKEPVLDLRAASQTAAITQLADAAPAADVAQSARGAELAQPADGADAAVHATGTREMPHFTGVQPRDPPGPGSRTVARSERKTAPALKPAAHKTTTKPSKAKSASKAHASAPGPDSDAVRDQIIADAVRLLQWGRNWFELPELIARMADRPPLAQVRRILNDNKTAIDAKAGRR
jgi:hypothetical protein